MDRRHFLHRSALAGGALFLSPLEALAARAAAGQPPAAAVGYGPLVLKGDLWLPAEFNYQVISRQGKPMSDGQVTPGIFDGMGAYPGPAGTTILIRNHENRERAGEIKVVTGPMFEYDEAMFGGNTKLEVRRFKIGEDPATGLPLYEYEVVRDFAILGGTSTNCAGGIRSPHQWLACEEVVKGPLGDPTMGTFAPRKHGYIFEIDARADGPVQAIPVPQAGRLVHEAALEQAGIVYLTEDRGKSADPIRGQIGAAFYRYIPSPGGGGVPLYATSGPLQALAIRGEPNKDMDLTTAIGVPYPVEWVTIPDPDHDDETDNRRNRMPGFIPTRVQAADAGAAIFSRQEGMWAGPGSATNGAKVYFDCTSGGRIGRGQVWEYDAGRETLTLIYESTNRAMLENPDNVVIVPKTGDIFLQEDSSGDQFVRGVTRDGEIYDFCKNATNPSEFCGGCFDPDGQTLYLNQQGQRLVAGPGEPPPDPNLVGVTYAIYGPFEKREGNRNR